MSFSRFFYIILSLSLYHSALRAETWTLENDVVVLDASDTDDTSSGVPEKTVGECNDAKDAALVFVYHKFDEFRYPQTSVSSESFKDDLNYLANNGFNVISLDQLVSAINGEIPFGKQWVVITVDDGYKSFFEKAKPILEDFYYPYTMFVIANAHGTLYMNLNQLKEIRDSVFGSVESHTDSHGNLLRINFDRRKKQLENSVTRIYSQLGIRPFYLAYPYGLFNETIINQVKNTKILIGNEIFQFKGALSLKYTSVNCDTNAFNIPRLNVTEEYGIERHIRIMRKQKKINRP